MNSSIDPEYYESHGYWLRSPDWNLLVRYERECEAACKAGLACWLSAFDPDNADIPF
jgi:hypothetical protein